MSKAVKAPKAERPSKGRPAAEAEAPVAQADAPKGPAPTPRLKEFYVKELRARLKEQLGVRNVHEVPRLVKISINAGLGEGIKEYKVIEEMARDLATITGQKPVICRAQKDVAAFGVRGGQPVGLRITLRSKRMYEFLDRFISVALPRVRDFRGIPPSNFDSRGNLTVGVREHTVFPEIDIEKVFRVKGMNVTFVTSTPNTAHAKALLEGFGMPFTDRK